MNIGHPIDRRRNFVEDQASSRSAVFSMEVTIATQVAALPYRFDDNGNVEVMLITSRGRGEHWIPPKGHLMTGKRPHEAAAQEAFEEAGVVGLISDRSIGEYSATKSRSNGAAEKLNVVVFPMRVVERMSDWPERGQRTTLWFEPGDAARAVREPGLARLLTVFRPPDAS